MPMLTEAQHAAYRNDGFIVVPGVFSQAETAELRAVTEEFVRANRKESARRKCHEFTDARHHREPWRRGPRRPAVARRVNGLSEIGGVAKRHSRALRYTDP